MSTIGTLAKNMKGAMVLTAEERAFLSKARNVTTTKEGRELLSIIANSKDPERAIKIAAALLDAINDEAFYQKIKELQEKGYVDEMRAMIDAVTKDL